MSKLIRRLLWGVGLLLVALVIGVGTVIGWAASATTGPRIGPYAAGKRALLVVDIQEDYTGKNARKPYRDGDRARAQ